MLHDVLDLEFIAKCAAKSANRAQSLLITKHKAGGALSLSLSLLFNIFLDIHICMTQ